MRSQAARNTIKIRGAVLYTRVSTGEQDKNGTSPETQRAACRAKALALSLPIVAEYHDGGMSGGFLLSRTGFQAALTDIQEGRADTLICPSISRYSRDVEHQQAVKKAVKAAGGQLVFCDMNFEDTPEGDLNFTIQGGFAEYEKAVIRQRTMKGKRKRAEDGQQPSRTTSPYGYRIVNKADVLRGDYPHHLIGQYQILEDQASVVRELFARYASGTHSLNQLARWLNTEKIPTPGKAAYWWASGLSYMLTNSVYKGEAHFGWQTHRKKESRLSEINPMTGKPYKQPIVRHISAQEDVVDLACPAIVDTETWELVRTRMSEHKYNYGGNPERVRMLSGKVFCPECGGRMVSGAGGNSSYVNVHGETIRYPKERRYLCTSNVKRYSVTGEYSCTSASYMIRRTEVATVAAIAALLDATQTPNALREALRTFRTAESRAREAQEPSASQNDPAAIRIEKSKIDDALSILKTRQDATIKAQIAGIMAGANAEAYSGAFASIAAERRRLEDRRSQLARLLKTFDQERKAHSAAAAGRKAAQGATGDVAARALALAYEVLTSDAVPNAKKRAIIGTLVDKVICQMDGAKVVFLPGVISEISEIEKDSDGENLGNGDTSSNGENLSNGNSSSSGNSSNGGVLADALQTMSMIFARISIWRVGPGPRLSRFTILSSGGKD